MIDPRLTRVIATLGSAELLTCGLVRKNRPTNAPSWAVNVFSVLRFLERSATPSAAPRFVTKRPESLPKSDHQLFISVSDLSVPEATALFGFTAGFSNPRASRFAPIDSPGVWTGPEFVGREEHRARSCVPTREPFWLLESWRTGTALEDEVQADGADWIFSRVRELLAVDLHSHRERFGNFLIVLPEHRHRMRVWWPRKTKLGVEVVAKPGGPTSFLVMVRASRDSSLLSSEHRVVAPGLHLFDVPEAVDHRSIELYDHATGTIIDRDAGRPLRAIQLSGNMATQPFDLTFTFLDGSPSIRAQGWWGTTMRTVSGGHATWELKLSDARTRERRERLREEKRVLVYRGSASERRQAVFDIRSILQTHLDGYLKIWDPYFGVREAAEFVPCVFDPSISVQILTSVEPAPNERARPKQSPWSELLTTLGEQVSPYLPTRLRKVIARRRPVPIRTIKKEQLKKVLDRLRRTDDGRPIFGALECHVGGEMFHDRFIITRDRCWQLGCSFNQIGGVMSTLVDFPYPALIEREFDRAWELAKESL